ncbi:hypothetical protein [Pelagicoccus sp. SDUM812002]|uniref:hypothetical protein n=1 Tax=Pelagicoccus sp. SDUM812002 TaxID=3041266 RepID=UPI00280DB07F|nr:hypothetical protein [Pelagicoccus sp. SDUM812002]MDQ8184983.1 hypothetical protein [Pelagicoccus sp. SDUM812002]
MKLTSSVTLLGGLCLVVGLLFVSSKLNLNQPKATEPSATSSGTEAKEPYATTETKSPTQQVPNSDPPTFLGQYNTLTQMDNGPEKVEATLRLFRDWGESEGEAAK